MKKNKVGVISFILAGSLLLASCSSSTVINSSPAGARVFLNGEAVGTTPYKHTDTKIVGSYTSVKLEKEGYEPLNVGFSRSEQADVGAIIGGIFVLVPFLWTMKYKPERTYEMVPLSGTKVEEVKKDSGTLSQSKSEELRNLKKLLDDKIITAEEFEKEKKKILDK
ncbi:PEGA domain-containing protein [Dysgonomonas alginatilytica]|uniref:PEGA domain-containing protein n=1 Tax=Dysgonomonas alginatilytica TaxID=1605892 RepID=A0A2V3Q1M6_9BACT|nr:PEGA domain-containing protein [Dysgonomonas alginatilytica]PXV69215.1 PEGA domain-containing protein [Dysgonomonas alginatilytica]